MIGIFEPGSTLPVDGNFSRLLAAFTVTPQNIGWIVIAGADVFVHAAMEDMKTIVSNPIVQRIYFAETVAAADILLEKLHADQ